MAFTCECWLTTGQMLGIEAKIGPDAVELKAALCLYLWANSDVTVAEQQRRRARI